MMGKDGVATAVAGCHGAVLRGGGEEVEVEDVALVTLGEVGKLVDLIELLGGEVVLFGVKGHEDLVVALTALEKVAESAGGRSCHFDDEVAEGLPHELHVVELGVVDITRDGHVEDDLLVLVLENIEGGLEGEVQFGIDILAAVADGGLVNVDFVLAFELAVVDGVVAREGKDTFGKRLAEEGEEVGAEVGEVEVLDGEADVLALFPVGDGALPVEDGCSAVGEVGEEAGVVAAAEGEVVGLEANVGDGEAERLGECVVILII